jgi:hypothetical protein
MIFIRVKLLPEASESRIFSAHIKRQILKKTAKVFCPCLRQGVFAKYEGLSLPSSRKTTPNQTRLYRSTSELFNGAPFRLNSYVLFPQAGWSPKSKYF